MTERPDLAAAYATGTQPKPTPRCDRITIPVGYRDTWHCDVRGCSAYASRKCGCVIGGRNPFLCGPHAMDYTAGVALPLMIEVHSD